MLHQISQMRAAERGAGEQPQAASNGGYLKSIWKKPGWEAIMRRGHVADEGPVRGAKSGAVSTRGLAQVTWVIPLEIRRGAPFTITHLRRDGYRTNTSRH